MIKFLLLLSVAAIFLGVAAGHLSQVENNEKILAITGTQQVLKLSEHKVPDSADEVVVFARVRCGYLKGDVDGYVHVSSGVYERKLFFHTYHQGAWSFNSDYFTLPISDDRTVRASVKTTGRGKNFQAAVQVVGYTCPAEFKVSAVAN